MAPEEDVTEDGMFCPEKCPICVDDAEAPSYTSTKSQQDSVSNCEKVSVMLVAPGGIISHSQSESLAYSLESEPSEKDPDGAVSVVCASQ